MQLASIGFLLGVLGCQSLTKLPETEWCLLILLLVPGLFRFPRYRFYTCVALGFLYSVFIAQGKLADQLSANLEGNDLLIQGEIISLPNRDTDITRFVFAASDYSELSAMENPGAEYNNIKKPFSHRLILSWYKTSPDLRVGQHWQLLVRLKRPHGFSNPGGFDYEAWLYQQGIDATGYVRDQPSFAALNYVLGQATGVSAWINQLREQLSLRIMQLSDSHQAGLITALLAGDRQYIEPDQWRVLTTTGTNHLMAISGLHIGLISGLIFWLTNRLWPRIPKAALYIASPRIAAVCALIAAVAYAALAGFSLPTQRAVIMIAIAMLAIWRQVPVVSSKVLATALFAVLLYDPTAVINSSFWLSFAAVAIIFYAMSGRLSQQNWWWKWGRVQWVIALGLSPIVIIWYQQISLLSPVANLVAVPVVSLVTVPLSLLTGLLLPVWPGLAHATMTGAVSSLDFLWPMLSAIAEFPAAIVTVATPPHWVLLPALIGVLYLLAPRGLPVKAVAVVWLMPLVISTTPDLAERELGMTVLDVGQGLAVVLQTQHHVLLYDAGPRLGQSDAGNLVVAPFLKSQGIHHIDRVILSHEDIDHTGGFASLRNNFPIDDLMLTPGMHRDVASIHYCNAGIAWNWDGVHFRVMHPLAKALSARDNNRINRGY